MYTDTTCIELGTYEEELVDGGKGFLICDTG